MSVRVVEAPLPLATNNCCDCPRRFHALAPNFAKLFLVNGAVSRAVNDGQ